MICGETEKLIIIIYFIGLAITYITFFIYIAFFAREEANEDRDPHETGFSIFAIAIVWPLAIFILIPILACTLALKISSKRRFPA